jgi:glucose/arabinose dehydrogenase
MFVAEKAGRVQVVRSDGTRDPVPLVDISDHVNSYLDRGLLGLAVDADFAANGYLYLLYTYEPGDSHRDSPSPVVSRLTRIDLRPDGTLRDPDDPETVLLGSEGTGSCPPPGNEVDCIPADAEVHTIGTVRSDTDGTLWVGSGDAALPGIVSAGGFRSLDEQSMAGKVLHVDRHGRGLPGHPFCPGNPDLTHVCTKLDARGLRNPFRFTLRPGAGPVVGDVGLNAREEVDLTEAGRSYGWPCYEGTLRTPGYDASARCAEEYLREGDPGAAVSPAYQYDSSGGGAIVMGPRVPVGPFPASYEGAYFFGDYVQGALRLLRIPADGAVAEATPFATGWHGVDLELAPEGELAYVDFGDGGNGTGAVRAIAHAPGNKTPLARVSADPAWGAVPLDVQFTGSHSSDPDGDALSYDWDFGDGTPHSSEPDPTHVYTTKGTFVARLTVDDGRGRRASAAVRTTPGNSPPQVSIEAPLDGAAFQTWHSVPLLGSAFDEEDGELSGGALDWHVVLHHGGHVHDLEHLPGSSTSFRPLQSHDADSHYGIELTATDSAGSTGSRSISIRPQVVPLALRSSPDGAPLTYAEQSLRAPFPTLAAVGFWTSISAAESFRAGPATYIFDRWSDGGARLHEIVVPAAPTTITAFYREQSQVPGTGARGARPSAVAPPRITAFSVRDRRFGVSRRATPTIARRGSPRPARGTSFRYRLSKAAGVRIVIARAADRGRGRRAGTLVRRNRRAGLNHLRFTGRIGRRALRPGAYVAMIQASDAAGQRSPVRRAGFRIVAR